MLNCSVFFSPRKKKFSPRKFSRFCPRIFASAREKILKTAREKKIVPVKNFANLHPRKKKSVGEKKIRNFALKIAKNPRKFFDLYPRNPNFNPRKKIILRPRKHPSAGESLCKIGREK